MGEATFSAAGLDPHVLFCETTFKIDFFEVDSMRIAWHGNYVNYFERARCALLEKIGMMNCSSRSKRVFKSIW